MTAPYRWELVTPAAAFAGRDGAGALVWRDKMWLIGGWSKRDPIKFPRTCSNDVWCSADGEHWECVRPNTYGNPEFDPAREWAGRHCAGYVVHDDQLWIVGGDGNQGNYQNEVWRSSNGAEWEQVAGAGDLPWRDRLLHHTVEHNGRIWVMGGQTLPQFVPADSDIYYNDVWSSADGVHWEQAPVVGERWSPRGMIGGQAVRDGRIWLMGGGTYDTPSHPDRIFHHDVWSSADGSAWQCHTDAAAWHPRSYHEVAVFDSRLWVMEGHHYSSRNRNDVWYSDDGAEWTELPGTPWPPRHAASVFVFQDSLWMVAGNNMEPDVWRLSRVV